MGESETRVLPGLELRVGGGARPRLVGWAAKFNADSLDLGGFIEVIRPGAFTRTLATGTDVRAFVEHNAAMIIGRRGNGSLIIGEDADGLHVEIRPADTQAGRDVIENVRVGNLDAMSFAFRVAPDGATWDLKAQPPLRELRDVDLLEVSVVSLPAYPATEVAVRSLTAARSDQAARYPRGRTVAERLEWATAHAR
jgi:Escherichia/Staphylococcus phage prohead protease